MFGYKTIREKDLKSLQVKIDGLEAELKGYYENAGEINEYFKAIAPLLHGTSIRDVFGVSVDRKGIRQCYLECAPAWGIINKIAKAVGEMFPYLELRRRDTGDYVENHWLLDLLHKPNDRYNCARFGQAWAVNRLAYGDCFVYAPKKVGKDRGQGKEMYIIPGDRVTIDKGGYSQPMKGITITGGGDNQTIVPANFFESFNYNPDDTSFFGVSPLLVAALYLSVIDRGMRRQDMTLKNGGPTSLITPKPDNLGVMPQTANTLTEELNSKEVKGQIKALRMAVDVHELGKSAVDLGILASHKEAITALCFIYDIPVDLYYGQSKYENAKEAKKALYESNAIPLANEFGADLLGHFGLGKEFTLTVNTDMIDVLKDDAADVLDNLAKMHATLNELREAYGYERIEEDYADKPMLPISVMFGNEVSEPIQEPAE